MITKFKIYELTEFEENNVIYSLGRSIKTFMNKYLGLIGSTNRENSTDFWYAGKRMSFIFELREKGDKDLFTEMQYKEYRLKNDPIKYNL